MKIELNLSIDERLITPEVKDFIKQAQKCIELYAKKNADYGNSFAEGMDLLGPIYGVGGIHDKHSRFIELHKPDKISQVEDETIDDTVRDMACYSMMFLAYREEKKETENLVACCKAKVANQNRSEKI